ncbi:MAG: site-2 protease family protein [Treponema sp.]|jgi:Zn-dependent protease|nr:site-2 protease family protein [Treponema sp.]
MDWERIIYSMPATLIGLTLHEFCHAWAGFKLGDTTARDQGRISLNPLKHIDPLGLLFIVFAGFGWAKPVQFNPDALRRPKRDKALIAAAGPLANLILGLAFIFALKAFLVWLPDTWALSDRFFYLLFYSAYINIGLFVFNMLPLPPLDGSHIFFSGLNLQTETEERIMRIGTPILFIILIIQSRSNITIIPIGKMVGAVISLFL